MRLQCALLTCRQVELVRHRLSERRTGAAMAVLLLELCTLSVHLCLHLAALLCTHARLYCSRLLRGRALIRLGRMLLCLRLLPLLIRPEVVIDQCADRLAELRMLKVDWAQEQLDACLLNGMLEAALNLDVVKGGRESDDGALKEFRRLSDAKTHSDVVAQLLELFGFLLALQVETLLTGGVQAALEGMLDAGEPLVLAVNSCIVGKKRLDTASRSTRPTPE